MSGKLSTEEKKVLIIWLIIGLVAFFLVMSIHIYKFTGEKQETYDKEYQILKDYDRYYTVVGALNKYYAFYNARAYESIFHILSNTYKEENAITLDNIKEFIPENEASLNFKGALMCYKTIDKGITSYLVKGYETDVFTGDELNTVYYNVTLDNNTFSFALEKIDSEFYGGNCHV